jgi:hypothetical protein
MRSFAFVFAAVFAAGASVVQAGSEPVTGSWAGEMRQVDVARETHYPMTLTFDGKQGATTYPQLKCAGTLTKIGEAKGGYALYHETIKNEPGATCIDGVVIVSVENGKLILGWYAAYQGSPALASAVLSPQAKN